MTTLLYVKEYIRGKMGADEIELRFDEDNLTNEEEILEQTMIEQVYFNLITSPKFGGPGGQSEEQKGSEAVIYMLSLLIGI